LIPYGIPFGIPFGIRQLRPMRLLASSNASTSSGIDHMDKPTDYMKTASFYVLMP
jgi:hypothetical protein